MKTPRTPEQREYKRLQVARFRANKRVKAGRNAAPMSRSEAARIGGLAKQAKDREMREQQSKAMGATCGS